VATPSRHFPTAKAPSQASIPATSTSFCSIGCCPACPASTSVHSCDSIVRGLEAGADDYIVKPAEPRVIEARLTAVLRRATPIRPDVASADTVAEPPTTHGELTVDRDAVTVSKSGETLELTPTEFRLLDTLIAHHGKVLSRHQLLEHVWNYGHLGDSRLVDACVQRLRAKIESDTRNPRYIQTVRGFGYRFGPL
jgi:DNA-binding response OmpR family regulator